MRKKFGLSRRTFVAGAGAAAGSGLIPVPAAWAAVDYKKYAGTKLEANLAKGPRGDLLQKHAKEFTEQIGRAHV